MAGNALTAASTLLCPHGGKVSASPANSRVTGDALLLTVSDTFTVSGCIFTLPNGQPSPCMTVTWLVSDQRAAAGAATLSDGDSGVCLNGQQLPQGAVAVAGTQQRVKAL